MSITDDVPERAESKTEIAVVTEPVSHSSEEKAAAQVDATFAGLSKWQAMRKFWRPCMYCCMTIFGVVMDGYQGSLPGEWNTNTRVVV